MGGPDAIQEPRPLAHYVGHRNGNQQHDTLRWRRITPRTLRLTPTETDCVAGHAGLEVRRETGKE
jgi:hypothetical protein